MRYGDRRKRVTRRYVDWIISRCGFCGQRSYWVVLDNRDLVCANCHR